MANHVRLFMWKAGRKRLIRQTELLFGKPHHHSIPFPRVRPAQHSILRTVFPEEFKFLVPPAPDCFEQFAALIPDKDIPFKAGYGNPFTFRSKQDTAIRFRSKVTSART